MHKSNILPRIWVPPNRLRSFKTREPWVWLTILFVFDSLRAIRCEIHFGCIFEVPRSSKYFCYMKQKTTLKIILSCCFLHIKNIYLLSSFRKENGYQSIIKCRICTIFQMNTTLLCEEYTEILVIVNIIQVWDEMKVKWWEHAAVYNLI